MRLPQLQLHLDPLCFSLDECSGPFTSISLVKCSPFIHFFFPPERFHSPTLPFLLLSFCPAGFFFFPFFFSLFLFIGWSYYIAEDGLELKIPFPQFPKCWDYRCVPLHPAQALFHKCIPDYVIAAKRSHLPLHNIWVSYYVMKACFNVSVSKFILIFFSHAE